LNLDKYKKFGKINTVTIKQQQQNVNMQNIICQYLNDRTGNRKGCVVAIGAGVVGWSLCNFKAGDKFNKEDALKNAIGRAVLQPVDDIRKVPNLLRDTVAYFKDVRSVRYFKV